MAKRIVVTGTRGIPDVPGGVETQVENLFPLLAEKGWDIHICCRACYIPVDKRISEYRGCKLKYINTPKKKSFEAIIHTFKSILYAKSIKADLLHIHAVGPGLMVPFARILGIKTVFTDHGPDYERQKWGKAAKFMLKTGESLGCRFSNAIIVISKVIKADISKKYKRNDIALIPNGVHPPVLCNKTTFLVSNNIQPRKFILSVARLVEEKGLHDLVEAFNSLDTGWKLVIAGDAEHETEYSKSLKAKAAQNPDIIMTGFLKGDPLKQLFENAGIFVLPSYHEGLPFALLEAMSYSLPVLVSDIEPHKEMELPPECYFHVADTSELGDKIINSINSTTRITDYSLYMKKYDWNIIADSTAKLYKEILL